MGDRGGRLARSAGLAGAATLGSRVLGLARETVLAAIFGAGNDMDAFNVAFRIPNLVRDLFAEGAMSAAFVPTFTRHLTRHGKTDAWRVGNNVINALILITGTLVALAMIGARPLVGAYAPEYASVPGKLDLTIRLTLVTLPFLTLATLAAALMGMLNSLNRYFVPALAPATFNAAMIACAFALVPLMPALGWPPIMAIAIAAIIGGVGQIAVQLPPLAREGFRYRPRLDLRDASLREVLVLMGPGTIGLAATQVNLFVNTQLATAQGTGAVSWLSYAFRLMYLPIGLFGVSIATAVLPAAARHATLDDKVAMRDTVARGLALMAMMNVPATLGLAILATPIVRLLFERGQFLPADTAATAAALRFYAIGLVGYSTVRIASPVFYALGQSRVPVAASLLSMAVNVVASLLLVDALGFRGLALGTSIAALANGGVLLVLLGRRLPGAGGTHLLTSTAKLLVASVGMAIVAWFVERTLGQAVPGGGVMIEAGRLLAAIGSGLAVLVVSAKLLRLAELDEAIVAARDVARTFLTPRSSP
ncbi:MAG: murein biosynthesis integral membrane protein MurJ [Acidobacteria bacterium RIFCSPLOWO2_02_FULL_65_29]|nr:MAG: murein biosynthesis integral membrane protein MurJ [Acidobacteria bacterium RIFCSPLOWO2_02_FULL_65_29]